MKYITLAVILLLFAVFPTSQLALNAGEFKTDEARVVPIAQEDPEKAEVERVVRESQLFETLTLYTNPKSFDKEQLSKYWVPVEQGGEAIKQVEVNVRNLLDLHQHYGKESKNEVFDIISLTINQDHDYADVVTRERWYIPLYDENEKRVTTREPYYEANPIYYTLRKIEGRWLIQSNSTRSRKKA